MKSYREHLLDEIAAEANLVQLKSFVSMLKRKPRTMLSPIGLIKKWYRRANYYLAPFTTNGRKEINQDIWK